jgi:hypothetical protein
MPEAAASAPQRAHQGFHAAGSTQISVRAGEDLNKRKDVRVTDSDYLFTLPIVVEEGYDCYMPEITLSSAARKSPTDVLSSLTDLVLIDTSHNRGQYRAGVHSCFVLIRSPNINWVPAGKSGQVVVAMKRKSFDQLMGSSTGSVVFHIALKGQHAKAKSNDTDDAK